MSWVGLLYVVMIFIMFMSILKALVWPRDENGKMMSDEEGIKAIEKFTGGRREPPGRAEHAAIILLFVSLAMLGVALS